MSRRLSDPALAAALAVVLWAAVAGANDYDLPDAAAGGEIDVLLDPTIVVLGELEEARVKCALPGGATRVQMFAFHGRMRDIDTSNREEATAIYEPPEEFLPRIDVVAARVETENGPRWGYAVLQLVGQGQALIRTGAFAEATIDIGSKTYGPAKADRKGRVTIQVKVPPGTGVGRDGEGREVDLHVPKVQRCAIFPGAEEVGARSEEGLDFLVVPFSPEGAKAPGDRVEVEASRGRVLEERDLGEGARVARLVVGEGEHGIVILEASVEGSDAPPATAEVIVVSGQGAVGRTGAEAPEGGGTPEAVNPDVPWLGAALGGGVAWNLGALVTFDVAADLHVKLPFGDHRFFAGVEVNFSRATEERTADVALTETSMSSVLWTVPLGATAGYRFVVSESWAFPLALHLGAVLVESKIETRPEGSQADSTRELGYLFGVGASFAMEYSLGPGAVFIEGRYLGIIGSMETVEGNLSNLYVDLGYRFFFGG